MKEYALAGRTIGTTYYDTYGEAYADYLELDPSLVEYDGEVTIYKWDGSDWVDANRRVGMPEWVKRLKAKVETKRREGK